MERRARMGRGLASRPGPCGDSSAPIMRFAPLSVVPIGWLILAFLTSGCRTTPEGAGAGKYAAVEIRGFSRPLIELATRQIFEDEGYTLSVGKNSGPNSQTFEQVASSGANVMWGTWDMNGVHERVVVTLDQMTDDQEFLLHARAFRVRNKDDSILEESKAMGFSVQRKYQDLLVRVKRLLEPMNATPAAK